MTDSLVVGATDVPLIRKTIGQVFDEAVAKWSDREALVVPHQDIRWTWKHYGDEVDSFAKGLIQLGFKPGDRVGVWATNVSEWAVAQYATAKAGIIQVNINPAYRPNELEYVLKKVGCSGLITGVEFKTSNYIQMLRDLAPELDTCVPGELKSERLPELHTIIRLGEEHTPGMFNYIDVLESGQEDRTIDLHAAGSSLDCDDPINIQFTSGTTGAPKGATLSHHNIVNNGRFIGDILSYTEHDRVCVPVPLYHCFGMVGGNLASINSGCTIVYPDEAFDPWSTLQAVHNEKITSMYGVPTMFVAMLDHPDFDQIDVSSLRTGIMAGSPCPIELMKQSVSRFHMPEMTIAYGMTETSPVSFQSATTDPVEKRVGTVGRIHPHARCKIVDAEGNIVPRGEQGEICTTGYLIMKGGYWDDAEKTAEAIDEDGWMHTGDLGTFDEDGWLRITGRVKDMVIRGGENVYPREIEEFLYTHPKILEAQVFGVPDPKFGEEVAAWIQLKEGESLGEDDIKAFCKGEIAHYKIPRYIRFVDEFPMTVTGKIQKFEMSAAMSKELGLQEQETA